MKKHVYGLIIVTFILMLSLWAIAGAETTLTNLIEQGSMLLFRTDNISITAEAEFKLDGEVFKRMTANHIQNGQDAFRDILLETPRTDGTVRESGYMILTCYGNRAVYDRTYR